MRVISAGDGYRYLLKSVAAGDGDRDLSTPLTRYYAQTGTPPGYWLGSGLPDLGDDEGLALGSTVSEGQLRLLLGQGRDPVTGDALGRAYPDYRKTGEMPEAQTPRAARRAVAGFDYTFSVPKSVSVWWAVADGATQARIVAAHHAAIADVVALLEREVAATRTGTASTEGAVAQVDVHGVVASAFDHYDSRTGDPQLHTHVVISNKVRTVLDGRWRALDGRPMHAATVALSEHYNAVLADHLTRDLGVGWEKWTRSADRNPVWEIRGMPADLLEAFSSRSRDIDAETDRRIAAYVERHGRRPSPRSVIKLRAQATLATRPDKQVRPLAELTAWWRATAARVLGTDATGWAQRLAPEPDGTRPGAATRAHAANVHDDAVEAFAVRVVRAVGEKRSTWRHWNLWAEASRQTIGVRIASTHDRETMVARIVHAAEQASVCLTPAEQAPTPSVFRRADGSSVFRPRHADVYTSAELLEAEERLLVLSNTATAPAIDHVTVERVLRTVAPRGRRVGRRVPASDQWAAIGQIAASGRCMDVLVGPAGAGKTTTMRGLRLVWERQFGRGSVVGLAPSAAAAQALSDALGVRAENTAKWLYEHRRGRWALQPCQLVIVDEATLAGTYTLDTLAAHATAVGAKVLLVGDPHQLDAVEAGGAFNLLASRRREAGDLPELADVRRFTHAWEKAASLRLRTGDSGVLDLYSGHGRVVDGDLTDMLEAAYQAWASDIASGKHSLLIAEARDTVTELNARARADRIRAGHVTTGRDVTLGDGTHASAGDRVVTRRNDRRLVAGRGWVKNGDHWTVAAAHRDGSLTVRRAAGDRSGPQVRLPSAYVAAHVDLAYASTVHRAQGATVDTAHAVVTPSMAREAYYVAMTRGRNANISYVATDQPGLEAHQATPDVEEVTGRAVLAGVLRRSGAEQSAHQTRQIERERWGSIAQLAAEYDSLAAHAQRVRWKHLLDRSGLTGQQIDTVEASDAYGPLTALLRRAEADGHHPDQLLRRAVDKHRLEDADDPAAVLHYRIRLATSRLHSGERRQRLIAGIIPPATGAMPDHLRDALTQREKLIERRANKLVERAMNQGAVWARAIGRPPADPTRRRDWLNQLRIVAAYRDRYHVTSDTPVGGEPESEAQRIDAERARAAVHRAQTLSLSEPPGLGVPRRTGPERPGPSL